MKTRTWNTGLHGTREPTLPYFIVYNNSSWFSQKNIHKRTGTIIQHEGIICKPLIRMCRGGCATCGVANRSALYLIFIACGEYRRGITLVGVCLCFSRKLMPQNCTDAAFSLLNSFRFRRYFVAYTIALTLSARDLTTNG